MTVYRRTDEDQGDIAQRVGSAMVIRSALREDAATWERMRQAFWPSPEGEHAREIAAYFAGVRSNPAEVLIAVDDAGRPLGFAELSIRPYAEECYSGRVAYLEGWYVEPDARRKGVGAALVQAAEDWGRSQGCTEFASDAAIDNTDSVAAHLALGFAETGRIVCFRKSLRDGTSNSG
jgi:aminoglycoside 6'-N-acetyltransferase I